ncbi:MAG: TadE/TadG family type IV pilus assembly protein [Pseudomonadota bacterium]
MIRTLTRTLRRFRKREDGQMVVEFALAVPLMFTMFLTSVELGIYSMRQTFLDRGMDMTVRLVRLNTGTTYTHNDLKQMICDFSGFLPECDTTLRLEMNPIDPRAFSGFGGSADCVDVSKPVEPLRSFVQGGQHSLMLMRACYMFKPVFPSTGMGKEFTKDGSGRVKMVSVSAFVQEPT